MNYEYQAKLMKIDYPADIRKHIIEYSKMQKRLYHNWANISDRAFMKGFEFMNKKLSGYYDKKKGWIVPSARGINPYLDALKELKEDKQL